MANPKIENSNAIQMELEAFKDAILNNTETPVTIIDGNTLSYTLEGVCLLVSDLNMLMLRRVQGNNI